MERRQLATVLEDTFDGGEAGVRAVSRQASDLADSGRLAADAGYDLTIERVVDNLDDAPGDYTLVERWNWWVSSLALAYGDSYRRFRVRVDIDSQQGTE